VILGLLFLASVPSLDGLALSKVSSSPERLDMEVDRERRRETSLMMKMKWMTMMMKKWEECLYPDWNIPGDQWRPE
jgi:hypothetical protein